MQQSLPITIVADGRFSRSLDPLLKKLEMWINFQALKANWYGNQHCTLTFDFSLIRSLEEKTDRMHKADWVIEADYAYFYNSSQLNTIAFIAIEDLIKTGKNIEETIKKRLINIANNIATQQGFKSIIL